MASSKVWFAKDGTVAIDNVVASVSGSSSLASQISATGTWTSRIKNTRIEAQERDIEPINVMGVQQLKQLNRPSIVTATLTTVFYPQGGSSNTTFLDFIYGQGAAVGATGYNRYQGGEKASNDRTDMAALITLSRPGTAVADTVTFLLNNANVTSGPVTLDAEGHAEQELTIKCLAADFYIDSGVTADPAT